MKTAGDGLHSDGGGLYLRVKGGSRSWIFRFTRDGKKREMGLGSASALPLAEARKLAATARTKVTANLDPITERAAGAALAPSLAKPAEGDPVTFRVAADRFLQQHGPTWSNPKHRQQWHNTLDNYAAPLMNKRVEDITTKDVERCLADIWLTKIETASRVRGRIERVLSSCIARGERPGPNPAAWKDNLEHILPSQSRVAKVEHHPAVPVDDAPAAFARIWSRRFTGQGYGALVTTILTAARGGNIRNLRWPYVDPETQTITWPAEDMKSRKAHTVPISWHLALWLGEVPVYLSSGGLVHPGQQGDVLSDMTMTRAMVRSGFGDFTVHGWRSTFRDWAAREGWRRELAEHQLAHTVGSAVERAYASDPLVEARREMMHAWGCYLAGGLR